MPQLIAIRKRSHRATSVRACAGTKTRRCLAPRINCLLQRNEALVADSKRGRVMNGFLRPPSGSRKCGICSAFASASACRRSSLLECTHPPRRSRRSMSQPMVDRLGRSPLVPVHSRGQHPLTTRCAPCRHRGRGARKRTVRGPLPGRLRVLGLWASAEPYGAADSPARSQRSDLESTHLPSAAWVEAPPAAAPGWRHTPIQSTTRPGSWHCSIPTPIPKTSCITTGAPVPMGERSHATATTSAARTAAAAATGAPGTLPSPTCSATDERPEL